MEKANQDQIRQKELQRLKDEEEDRKIEQYRIAKQKQTESIKRHKVKLFNQKMAEKQKLIDVQARRLEALRKEDKQGQLIQKAIDQK